MSGAFAGTIGFGGIQVAADGWQDVFVGKFLGGNGTSSWFRHFGGAGTGIAYAVAADKSPTSSFGSLAVAGEFSGTLDFGTGCGTRVAAGGADAFVAKFSANGGCIWVSQFGEVNYDSARAVGVDASGNVVVAGIFSGQMIVGRTTLLSAGTLDLFLAKLGSGDGVPVWAEGFGGSQIDEALGVAVDSNSDIVLTGEFGGTVDFGTGHPVSTTDTTDMFLAKFRGTNGSGVWSKAFGGQSTGLAVAVDGYDNPVLAGAFYTSIDLGDGHALSNTGDSDILLAKYTANGGTLIWGKTFGADQFSKDIGTAVAVRNDRSADDGTIALTGTINGGVNFGCGPVNPTVRNGDIFVASFSNGGTCVWSQRYGGLGDDFGKGIALDSAGNDLATGNFAASVKFGGATFTNTGTTSGFLTKWAGVTSSATPTPTPKCGLDLDGSGPPPDVATDIVYIARTWLKLSPVPASFRVLTPSIPPDDVIAARVSALGSTLDVDRNGSVDVATDIVYVTRHLLGLLPVPASFRLLDPAIPADDVIAARIDALCP